MSEDYKKLKECKAHPQFLEMNSGRENQGVYWKDVMCPHCGHRRRLYDDGRVVEK